jgi:hypothetical protein
VAQPAFRISSTISSVQTLYIRFHATERAEDELRNGVEKLIHVTGHKEKRQRDNNKEDVFPRSGSD